LFSLPYITILLCIFTAWTWGGVLAGGVCAVGGAILAPIAIPAALGGIGFTAAGVAAGSAAASIMSVAGTGAVVAAVQSVGAAGLGTAGTLAAGAISGAAGYIAADNDC
jgi:hypothetical protein